MPERESQSPREVHETRVTLAASAQSRPHSNVKGDPSRDLLERVP